MLNKLSRFKFNRISLTTMLAVFIYGLVACGCAGLGNKGEVRPDNKQPVLRIGAIPAENVDKMNDQFGDFMKYLGEKTDRRVELFVAKDYSGIIDKMAAGELDVALFGPFSYILAHDRAKAQAFAAENKIGSGFVYHSVIIVHPDSGIASIGELKGKSFAFTDPASTSGHLIPKAIFKENGIEPERDFNQVVYAGNHDAAVLAVKKMVVDAAAVSETILLNLKHKGVVGDKDVRVIYRSEPVPTSVWAYRQDLDTALIGKIKEAFYSADMSALGLYGKDRIHGFIETRDEQYEIIRKTDRQLGISRNLKGD